MKKATAWIAAALVLAAAASSSAQTIGSRTDEKIRSAMVAEALENERQKRTLSAIAAEAAETERQEMTRFTRTRSRTRTWSGIALAAAGAATALMGRTCRPMGALPRDSVLPYHHETVMTSMTGLEAYAADGECRINFQIHVTVNNPVATSPGYQESLRLQGPAPLHETGPPRQPHRNREGRARLRPRKALLRDRHGCPPASPWRPSSPTSPSA